jgi:hypothetical protein
MEQTKHGRIDDDDDHNSDNSLVQPSQKEVLPAATKVFASLSVTSQTFNSIAT